ncbi:hypothetical protein ACJRO7_020308 [Eucalyptus globulus]|uniref:Uncharacterized protein n=1 Tax=Eucalyptus globulus TaxID=34317 RepID=A0ABD3KMD6_EUCGL
MSRRIPSAKDRFSRPGAGGLAYSDMPERSREPVGFVDSAMWNGVRNGQLLRHKETRCVKEYTVDIVSSRLDQFEKRNRRIDLGLSIVPTYGSYGAGPMRLARHVRALNFMGLTARIRCRSM